MFRLVSSLVIASGIRAAEISLVTFDGEQSTTHKFKELNDPVMGGKSKGTWSVDDDGKFGVFDGEVVNVPSLKAPGFITAATDGSFPDASSAIGGNFILKVRTKTPDYGGFRFSFASGATNNEYACAGGGSLPFSRGCFKSKAFNVSAGDEFVEIKLPIDDFSDKWSSATGEQTETCASNSDVCPTAEKLKKISRVQLWAEGVSGTVHLEVSSIKIADSNGVVLVSETNLDDSNNLCKLPVQKHLRFNMSSRTTPETLADYVDATESLAEAVCCDRRTLALAEPQFTFLAPDIDLWSNLDADGVTTFYDSTCGIPLFKAPVNRTLEAFKADTEEHGWPSFREAEVISDNVLTDTKTGYVTSKCGTHLGSYLPDKAGKRWCIDLSCVSGNSKDM